MSDPLPAVRAVAKPRVSDTARRLPIKRPPHEARFRAGRLLDGRLLDGMLLDGRLLDGRLLDGRSSIGGSSIFCGPLLGARVLFEGDLAGLGQLSAAPSSSLEAFRVCYLQDQ